MIHYYARIVMKMKTGKKFDFRLVQNNDVWTAEITRQVTSKKIRISKSQDGFISESDAKEWGQKELKNFLHRLRQRNMHRSNKNK